MPLAIPGIEAFSMNKYITGCKGGELSECIKCAGNKVEYPMTISWNILLYLV